MTDQRSRDPLFWNAATWAAFAAGILALIYAVAFVLLKSGTLAAVGLLAGGILSTVAILALARAVSGTSPGLAQVGLVFGVAGAVGAAIHGAYDLANVLHPPAGGVPDLPSAVDPRGFLTFGLSGLGVAILSFLALRSGVPGWVRLGWLGLLLGALTIVTYLGRLIVLDANSILILAPAGLAGFIVGPLLYVLLGLELRRRP